MKQTLEANPLDIVDTMKKAERIVFDMELDIRAARDLCFILMDRLNRTKPLEKEEQLGFERVAIEAWEHLMATNKAYDELFVEVIRKGEPFPS